MTGVSRNPRDFSRMLFRNFLERGYEIIPVHSVAEEIEKRPAPGVCAKSARRWTVPCW